MKNVTKVWFEQNHLGTTHMRFQYDEFGRNVERTWPVATYDRFSEIMFGISDAELALEIVSWLSMFESSRQFQVVVWEDSESISFRIGDVPSPMTLEEIENKISWVVMCPSERFVRSHYGLMDLDLSLLEALRLRDEQLGGDGSFGSSTLRINDDYVMWSSGSGSGHLLFKKQGDKEEIVGVDMGTTMELSEWTDRVVKVSGLTTRFDRMVTAKFILGRMAGFIGDW